MLTVKILVEYLKIIFFFNYSVAEIILQIIEQFRGVINDAVKELLESQRHFILTGIPPTIPILDPLYIDEILIEPEEQIPGFTK